MTVFLSIKFKGCGSTQTTFYDTTIAFGFQTYRIYAFVGWDTLSTCPFPLQIIKMDSAEWQICYPTSLENKLRNEVNIICYPNPVSNILYINNLGNQKLNSIQLINLSGSLVKQFESNNRRLDVSELPGGIYLLRIESKVGGIVKKIVIE